MTLYKSSDPLHPGGTASNPVVLPPGAPRPIRRRLYSPASAPRTTQGTVPSYDGDSGQAVTRDYTLNVSDTAENRACPIGYGTNRYRPQIVHVEIVGSMLHMVYLLQEGEVDSLVSVLIGGTEVYSTAVAWCTTVFRPGSTSQTEITEVPSANWSSSYPGRALLYIRLDLTSAKFAGGLPDLEVIVKGLKVYDPRTSSTAWSENPILIARDLLTNMEYGAAVDAALLDSTSWNAAADRCDETVDSAARWRADFMVTDRKPLMDVVRDMLLVTCAGFLYWADGKWYARLDEQNVIGCRPSTATAQSAIDRAQSFTAPGPRIKVALKLDVIAGFSNPTLRLRSTLAGSDLATSTVTGLSAGNGQTVTFDLSAYRLTKGSTYYLVLLTTTGINWYEQVTDVYAGGTAWHYSAGWVQDTTYDHWFQCHFCDFEIRDALTAVAPEIPILARGGNSSLSFSRSQQEAPNAVEVSFYDLADWTVKPVRYEGPAVKAGTKQPQLLHKDALAVPSSSCAYRLSRQWYFVGQRTNRAGCLVPQHGVAIAPGDVVMLTSAIGPLTGVWYRVRSVQRDLGCFDLELIEYNWSDYSTEETVTLDAITIPNAVSTLQFIKLADEFLSGGAASGAIGDLGWTLSGDTTIGYTTLTNHPGIVILYGGASGGSIALSGASQKFAAKSVWSTEWIWQPNTLNTNTNYGNVVDVFNVMIYNAAGTFTLYVDGTSTGKTCVSTDWITVQNSCDGGGTAYCNIFKNGVLWHQTSKAVSTTTLDKYLYASTYLAGGTTTIYIDRAKLATGATR